MSDAPEPQTKTRPPETTAPKTSLLDTLSSQPESQLLRCVQEMEQSLSEIRLRLDSLTRERRYGSFSLARMIGAIAQALVVGFMLAALADWIFHAEVAAQIAKLGFAAVLQMGALTAFVVAREDR